MGSLFGLGYYALRRDSKNQYFITLPKQWVLNLDNVPEKCKIAMDENKNLMICPLKK